MGSAKSEECKGGVHNQDVPLYSNYKTDFSRRAMLLNAQTSANSCRYVESNFRLVVHTALGRIVSRPAKFCHKPFWRRHHSFVCLFGWLVGFLTSLSATRLYRRRVPRLTPDNFTCCHTRERAGRP